MTSQMSNQPKRRGLSFKMSSSCQQSTSASESKRSSASGQWLTAIVFAVAALLGSQQVAAQLTGTPTLDDGKIVFDIVAGYEWNTDDDFLGWTPNGQIDDAAVTGGALIGTSNGNDPIIVGPSGFTIGSGIGEVDRIQFAAQFSSGAPTVRTEMFFIANAAYSQVWTPGAFPAITDGNLHVYTLDFAPTDPVWGQTIGTFRLDPFADTPERADTFAYDYVRIGSKTDSSLFTPGDVTGDGNVLLDDFEAIRSNFFATGVPRSSGDLNTDGVVDLKDFGEWKDNYTGSSSADFASLLGTAVPEPCSALLAGFGLALTGLGWRRRR